MTNKKIRPCIYEGVKKVSYKRLINFQIPTGEKQKINEDVEATVENDVSGVS